MYQEKTPAPDVEEAEETPLPATLTFVLLIGVAFVILWFGVFALLAGRW
jgi:hypothetical protein